MMGVPMQPAYYLCCLTPVGTISAEGFDRCHGMEQIDFAPVVAAAVLGLDTQVGRRQRCTPVVERCMQRELGPVRGRVPLAHAPALADAVQFVVVAVAGESAVGEDGGSCTWGAPLRQWAGPGRPWRWT